MCAPGYTPKELKTRFEEVKNWETTNIVQKAKKNSEKNFKWKSMNYGNFPWKDIYKRKTKSILQFRLESLGNIRMLKKMGLKRTMNRYHG